MDWNSWVKFMVGSQGETRRRWFGWESGVLQPAVARDRGGWSGEQEFSGAGAAGGVFVVERDGAVDERLADAGRQRVRGGEVAASVQAVLVKENEVGRCADGDSSSPGQVEDIGWQRGHAADDFGCRGKASGQAEEARESAEIARVAAFD